jgi:hypothetical protein
MQTLTHASDSGRDRATPSRTADERLPVMAPATFGVSR